MSDRHPQDELVRNRIIEALRAVDRHATSQLDDVEIEALLDDAQAVALSEAEVARVIAKVDEMKAASAHDARSSSRPQSAMRRAIESCPMGATGDHRRVLNSDSKFVFAVMALVLIAVGVFLSRSERHEVVSSHVGNANSIALSVPPVSLAPARMSLDDLLREWKPRAIEVGETISTGARERRQVVLPDGSKLALNEATSITVTADRRVKLDRGEVFAEVNPEPTSGSSRQFVVETPDRSVTALGTKFGVSAKERDGKVVVTQGKVRVDGRGVAPQLPAESRSDSAAKTGATLVTAGEQLALATLKTEAAPRASHSIHWTRDLMVTPESVIVPKSPHAGGSVQVVDPNGQEMKLSLRKFHVDVHIEDGFARTTIDQTYFNHTWQRLEGTFRFPLPADASLSRLAMYVNGKLMEGGMVEKNYGRNVFEQIMHTKRDPALLEWLDGSTFQMRVFPLEPRQEKRIVMSYSQRLPSDYGKNSYRFPAGHSLEGVGEWSAEVRVKQWPQGGVWQSPSHALKETRDGGDLVLRDFERNALLDRDLVLEVEDPREPHGVSLRVSSSKNASSKAGPAASASPLTGDVRFSEFEQEGYRYLIVRYRPLLVPRGGQDRDNSSRPARHWVFVVENTADRDHILAKTQQTIVSTLLEHVEHSDTFSVIRAGTKAELFRKQPAECSAKNAAAALKFLTAKEPIGALDLGAALDAAVLASKGRADSVIVHLGSGIAVLGENDETALLRRLRSRAAPQLGGESRSDSPTYVGIAVGKRWSKSFMQAAAEQSRGLVAQINPDEAVAWRAFELLSTFNAPRLVDLAVECEQPGVTFLPFERQIADGQEFAAVTRLPAGSPLPQRVTIKGQQLNPHSSQQSPSSHSLSETLAVRDVAKQASYLPRTWARLEIDRLVALGAEEHKNAIIDLSKAMYVMSPFTSLLVLEDEAMYEQFKVDRGRKDHWAMYPAPVEIKVVTENVPGKQESLDELQKLATEQAAKLKAARKELDEAMQDRRGLLDVKKVARQVRIESGELRRVMERVQVAKQSQADSLKTLRESVLTHNVWRGNWNYSQPYRSPHSPVTYYWDDFDFAVPNIEGRWGKQGWGAANNQWFEQNSWEFNDDGLGVVDESIALPEVRLRRAINRGVSLKGMISHSQAEEVSRHQLGIDSWRVLSPVDEVFELTDRRGYFYISNNDLDSDVDGLMSFVAPMDAMTRAEFRRFNPSGFDASTNSFMSNGSLRSRMLRGRSEFTDLSLDGEPSLNFDAQFGFYGQPAPNHWSFINEAGDRFGDFVDEYVTGYDTLATNTQFLAYRNGMTPKFARPQFNLPTLSLTDVEADGLMNLNAHGNLRMTGRGNLNVLSRPELLGWMATQNGMFEQRGSLPSVSFSQFGLPALSIPMVVIGSNAANEGFLWNGPARGDLGWMATDGRIARQASGEELGVNARYMLFGTNRLDPALSEFESDFIVPLGERRPQGYEVSRAGYADTLAKLRRKVSLHHDNVLLSKIVQELLQGVGMGWNWDNAAMAAPDGNVPVTIHLDNVPLSKALQQVLEPHGMGVIVQPWQIRVVSIDEAIKARIVQQNRVRPLVDYAPGLQTTQADRAAVLEAEGGEALQPRRGTVSKEAAVLIAKARARGWEEVHVPAVGQGKWDRLETEAESEKTQSRASQSSPSSHDAVSDSTLRSDAVLLVDGAGRFMLDRTLTSGLSEQLRSDGSHFWSLYPEISLGAKRTLSRFHRADLQGLVPWLVPTLEDLSVGVDVSLVTERMLRLMPCRRGVHRVPSEAGDKKTMQDARDGIPCDFVELEFDADTRLIEKRWLVRAKADAKPRVLRRITFAADGLVQVLSGEGKELATVKFDRKPIEAPQFKVETENLVVLPLPYRARTHWGFELVKTEATSEDEKKQGGKIDYTRLTDEQVMRVVATYFTQSNQQEFVALMKSRCMPIGDVTSAERQGASRRSDADAANDKNLRLAPRGSQDDCAMAKNEGLLGYAVLLSSLHQSAAVSDLVGKFPDAALGRYLEHCEMPLLNGDLHREFVPSKSASPFIKRLCALHNFTMNWCSGRYTSGPSAPLKSASLIEQINRDWGLIQNEMREPVTNWVKPKMLPLQNDGRLPGVNPTEMVEKWSLFNVMVEAIERHPPIDNSVWVHLAEIAVGFEVEPLLQPTVEEARIRWMTAAGHVPVDLLRRHFDEAFGGGMLSPLNAQLRQAVVDGGSLELWTKTVREAMLKMDSDATNVTRNVKDDRSTATGISDEAVTPSETNRPTAVKPLFRVAAAQRCFELGDVTLAWELCNAAIEGRSFEEHRALLVAAFEFYRLAGDNKAAEALMPQLVGSRGSLREPKSVGQGNASSDSKGEDHSKKSSIKKQLRQDDPEIQKRWFAEQTTNRAAFWRMAADVALAVGDDDESLRRLERAFDLEFAQLPEQINLPEFESAYATLFARYDQLAPRWSARKKADVDEFASRVAKFAQHWIHVVPDDARASETAAKVFMKLGRWENAWEYWTVPVAQTPDRSNIWQTLARQLDQAQRLNESDLAWSRAVLCEPTNPDLLEQQALLAGKRSQREREIALLRQIVDGHWQPRFSATVQRAKQKLGL